MTVDPSTGGGRTCRRRTLLRTVGGTVVAGTLTGCIGGVPLRGGGAVTGSFWQWLHEPGEVLDVDHYRVLSVDSSAFLDHESELPDSAFDTIESTVEQFSDVVDLDFDETQYFYRTNVGEILSGSLDVDDAEDELEDADFDDETEHESYTIYVSADERQAVGVNGEQAVRTRRSNPVTREGPVDVLETMIDVSRGEEDRYRQSNDALNRLSAKVPTGALLQAETFDERRDTNVNSGTFEGSVASGSALSLNGETATGTWVVVFEDEGELDEDDLQDWTDEADDTGEVFDEYDDLSVSTDGRIATVSGTIDTDDLWES